MQKIRDIKAEIRDEYLSDRKAPWIIGFSGGKDSTILTQLVMEVLLSIAPDARTRQIFIVYNDTRVESPVFQEHVTRTLSSIENGIAGLNVPVQVVTTTPPDTESFWVNLLGKGYPAPNRSFRWCMDRLKIRPTSRFIKDQVSKNGEAVLLLGVRRAESVSRQQRIDKYSEAANFERLVPNHEIDKCWIFRPLIELDTDEVWAYLENNPAPWGHSATMSLLSIYQDAGMCNATQTCALIDDVQVADSKSILARFGCWTCTVVRQDRSLEALVEGGYDHLKPLVEFRTLLRTMSDTPEYRSKTRRSGQSGLGPLTLEARELLLNKLLGIQETIGLPLISDHEVHLIQMEWLKDRVSFIERAYKTTHPIPTSSHPK